MIEGLVRGPGRGEFRKIGAADDRGKPSGRGKAGGAKAEGRAKGGRGHNRAREEGVPDSSEISGIDFPRAAAKKRGRRSGRIILAAVAALLGAGAVVTAVVFVPSTFVLRKVVVAGAVTLAPRDVIAASRILPGKPLLSTDLGLAERNLDSWAPVARARASYVFPDAVRLEIVERAPVALALVDDAGATVAIAVDAEGVTFAPSAGAGAAELPLLSGIRFDGWSPGVRLPDYLLPTVASLVALEKTDSSLLSLISEIRVERTNWGEVELLLFPLHHAIPVRTGPRLDAALLRSIVLVLDALDKGGVAPKVGELDFRSGTVVFRSKEGRSG